MIRQLDDKTSVGGQIGLAEMPELKSRGITMVVNNRPDGEEPDQPTSAEVEAAAQSAGLDYRHIPIRRGIGPSDVEAMRKAIRECDGKLLAFCRSGNRSALAWAVARSDDGVPAEELRRLAGEAGIDLGPVAHLL